MDLDYRREDLQPHRRGHHHRHLCCYGLQRQQRHHDRDSRGTGDHGHGGQPAPSSTTARPPPGIPAITSGSLATGDTAAFSETYDTPAAGTGKTLTPAGSVNDGNSGNNYAVTLLGNTSGAIG